jgi:hypothetical protein
MAPSIASDTDILEQGIALLRKSLPPAWQVQKLGENESDSNLGDAVLNIGSTQWNTRVVVEIKRTFGPKDVAGVVRDARLLNRVAANTPVLVLAPQLSDRSRAALTEAGINYLDLTGATRLVTEYPMLFISQQGNSSTIKRRQSVPALRGVKAGRVVRLLADVRPPYGVLEIAKYAQVTPGYVSRLIAELQRQDIVGRAPRGPVERVDWRELLKRRAESYAVFTSNRLQTFVSPKGAAFALESIRDLGAQELVLSGSFGAEQLISLAPPALLLVYSESDDPALIDAAGLLPAAGGANVIIAKPYDSVVVERLFPNQTPVLPRVPLVAASQLAIDCLTGSGRMPQEGEALLDWMAEDESRWRLPTLADLPVPKAPM